jgi:Ca2+-binding RTX toxin-like protein
MTTFTGSNSSDNIISDADLIFARKGDDVVHATHPARPTGDAAVAVFGGEGNDLLLYEGSPPGAAVLFGGDGADTLQGGSGDDFLSGDRGLDLL